MFLHGLDLIVSVTDIFLNVARSHCKIDGEFGWRKTNKRGKKEP